MITYVINTSENQIYDSNNLFENSMITLAGYNRIRWMSCRLDEVDTCARDILEQQSRLGVGPYRIAVLIDFYGFDRIRASYGQGRNGYNGIDEGVDFSLYLPYIESYLETHLLNPLRCAEADPAEFSVYYVQNSHFDVIQHIDNGIRQVRDNLLLWDVTPVDEDDDPFAADGEAGPVREGTQSHRRRTDDTAMIEKLRAALDKLIASLLSPGVSEPEKRETPANRADILHEFPESLRFRLLRPDEIRSRIEQDYDNEVTDFADLCSNFEDGIRRFNRHCSELEKDRTALKNAREAWRQKQDPNPDPDSDSNDPEEKKALDEWKSRLREKETELLTTKGELTVLREKLEKRYEELSLKKRYELERYDSFTLYCTPSVSLTFRMRDYPCVGGMRFHDFHMLLEDLAARNATIHRHFYPAFNGGGASRAAFDTLSLSLYLIWLYEREEIIDESEIMEVHKIQPDILREVLVEAWNKIRCAQQVVMNYTPEYYVLDVPSELPAAGESEAREDQETQEKAEQFRHDDADSLYRRICDFASHKNHGMDEKDATEFERVMETYLERRDELKSGLADTQLDYSRENMMLRRTSQYPSQLQLETAVAKREKEISATLSEALEMEYAEMDYSEEQRRAEEAYGRYRKAKESLRINVLWDSLLLVFSVLIMVGSYAMLHVQSISSAPWLFVGLSLPVFAGAFILAYVLQMLPLVREMRAARDELEACCEDCARKHVRSLAQLKARYIRYLPAIEIQRYSIRNIRSLYAINQSINNRLRQHTETLNTIENSLSSVLSNLGVEPRLNPEVDVEDELDLTQDVNAPSNRIYRVLSLEIIEKLLFPGGKENS